jgi:hypothetical protein
MITSLGSQLPFIVNNVLDLLEYFCTENEKDQNRLGR